MASMIKNIIIILMIFFCFYACKNNEQPLKDNITKNDNILLDNSTITKDNITDTETVINFYTNVYGKKVTEIYKLNSSSKTSVKENAEIMQLLSNYSDNSCINMVKKYLGQYNINDKITDVYIGYANYTIYEPTVLHIAVICGELNVIKLLLNFGADIYALDGNGENVIDAAYHINESSIIDIIDKEKNNEFTE